jgi:hypothetical protein
VRARTACVECLWDYSARGQQEAAMTITILDPRTGVPITITVPDKPRTPPTGP